MLNTLQNIAMSGAGIGFVLFVLAKFIPDAKLAAMAFALGKKSSAFGRSKLGRPWEKIEDFIEHEFQVFFKAFWEGADADDNDNGTGTPPPSASSSAGGVAGAVLLLILLLPSTSFAEILLVQWGRFAVHLPLARVDTTYLYDFVTKDSDKASRWGGETPLFNVPVPWTKTDVTVVFGATTDTIRKGEPFIGINHEVDKIVAEKFDVGIFGGKRLDSKDWMFGLKCSYPLWGAPKD